MTHVAYFVHNLADPAVERRVRMLRAGGAEVILSGFWRGDAAPASVAGVPVVPLGQSFDANLRQRLTLVGRTLARGRWLADIARRADVLLARNLEMLVVAARARKRGQRLVYECLDIHRSMLGGGAAGGALRAIERKLLSSTSLLLYSSPAFLRQYFKPVQHFANPSRLIENKMLVLGNEPPVPPRTPGPPWTIGWFGNLRCRRSLEELSWIGEKLQGRARILVAGRASPTELPDLQPVISRPNIEFVGAYGASDLPRLYARCHFAWSVDYFEEGMNSEWLLPNRIYEAVACGAVPVAREGTETARWLNQHSAGICLPRESAAQAFSELLTTLDQHRFDELQSQVRAVPRDAVVAGQADCDALVSAVAG